MAFNVNTNVASMGARAQGTFTQYRLQSSLEKLSSGLRINKAADDSSGMAIADALRSQANALGQAMRNTNDGIGIIQIADKAMDEQIKILDLIKTKATQAAQDGQSTDSRKAIQADINRLIESLDNIAATTSYNGQNLLSGNYNNKEFQVGAYSNQTIRASIGATSSDKIGQVTMRTAQDFGQLGGAISAAGMVNLTLVKYDGQNDLALESVRIGWSGTDVGLGRLAEAINKASNITGVRASWSLTVTSEDPIQAGTLDDPIVINGVTIGKIADVKANDSDGKLVAAINAVTDQTGVQAYTDAKGRLNLTSLDGRAIRVQNDITNAAAGGSAIIAGNPGNPLFAYIGRLTLTRTDGRAIVTSGAGGIGLRDGNTTGISHEGRTTLNLRSVRSTFTKNQASAFGAFANKTIASDYAGTTYLTGVTSLKGAMAVMNIAESAMKQLDKIRADLGSVQQQMQSTLENITVTQVNVKASEAGIREVDFAEESSNYSRYSILAQSGAYAISQANASQQNILRLLQ